MDLEAKVKEDMASLGCTSKQKIALAYHLYIYLVDTKRMYDAEYCYNKDVDTLYVVARPSKEHKLNIYVPFPTHADVSMELVDVLQENLCTVETGPAINLAFTEGDFTTVIYNFTKGLLDMQSPEGLLKRKTRVERQNLIDNELLKRKDDILSKALHGGEVEEDDCELIG